MSTALHTKDWTDFMCECGCPRMKHDDHGVCFGVKWPQAENEGPKLCTCAMFKEAARG